MKHLLRKIKAAIVPTPAGPSVPLNFKMATEFLYFQRLFALIKNVEGDVVECGVGRGKSLLLFAFLVKDEMRGRRIWAFDSFEGFPEPTPEDMSIRASQKGDWGDVSIPMVQRLLETGGIDQHFLINQVTIIKGFFNESLTKYRGEKIAILHLDGDLYESYKDPLRMLYPKLVRGGVVLFDEYLNTNEHMKFPGGQKAIDEFFGDDIRHIKRDHGTGKYYMVKP